MNVTNSVTGFFKGNSYSSAIGSLCEKVTNNKNDCENWELIMKVCDLINENEDGPKLAIRAIKRRLTVDVKNSKILLYTLTLLEACVKNCGSKFHLQVCNRKFLQELEKIVVSTQVPKNIKSDLPNNVRDRILLLIQSWYDSFKSREEFREIEVTYKYLLTCCLEFPMTNLTTMSPINTPKKSVPSIPSLILQPQNTTAPVSIVEDAETKVQNFDIKLAKNLSVVQGNINVLNELMLEYPPQEHIPDNTLSLIKDLITSCLEMQRRLIELINKLDEITTKEASSLFDLLTINDDLNNTIVQYGRYERIHIEHFKNIMSDHEVCNRIAKSSLSDIYAAQQEASHFYKGFSKIKTANRDKILTESSSSTKVDSITSAENKSGRAKLFEVSNKESTSSNMLASDDKDEKIMFSPKRQLKEDEIFSL